MKKTMVLALMFLIALTWPVQAALIPLGSYQISLLNAVSENNGKNAALAASLLNGTTIAPGSIFSYNKSVGIRTTERGFTEGLMFGENGKLVNGVGGGVCMTSSILHQAVKAAGLTVLERHDHSSPTSYLQQGEDAAVVYGIEDYRFMNNTDDTLMIEGKVENDNLIMTVNRVLPEQNCNITITLNEQPFDIDTRLVFDHNVSFTPLRVFAEGIGATVGWNTDAQMAEIYWGNTMVSVPVDQPQVIINGQTAAMGVPAQIIDCQTMLPVRSSCEAMGLTVSWEPSSGAIYAQPVSADENAEPVLTITPKPQPVEPTPTI
ncbi:MAG: VanW family protein [Syntrophomonadaceae bacterium]